MEIDNYDEEARKLNKIIAHYAVCVTCLVACRCLSIGWIIFVVLGRL